MFQQRNTQIIVHTIFDYLVVDDKSNKTLVKRF